MFFSTTKDQIHQFKHSLHDVTNRVVNDTSELHHSIKNNGKNNGMCVCVVVTCFVLFVVPTKKN